MSERKNTDAIPAKPQGDINLPFPLHDDEEVFAYLHRHWFVLYPRLLAYLAFAVVPPAILIAVAIELDFLEGVGQAIVLIASLAWFLFWLFRFLLTWYRYNNDIWVISDQRIVDSIKLNPFNLRMSSADLVDVVDTNISRSGIIHTLLNFGDVQCQTAGSSTNFKLENVPQPAAVQSLVDRLRDIARRGNLDLETPADR
ncbi:MAG: hypothetical protein GEU28_02395 [Dehalococcoidia bacterium]|nr:hypothetical protein [Dehalococcoidia bacterium]